MYFCRENREIMGKQSFIILILGALLLTNCNKAPQATIEGTLTEAAGKTLYLDVLGVDRSEIADSVKLKDDGEFRFHVPRPECYDFYRLRCENELVNICVDSTETIHVEAALPTMSIAYQVTGSEDNVKLRELVMKQIELQNNVRSLIRNGGPETGVTRARINDMLQQYKDSVRLQYIYQDPSKPYAYFALFQRLGGALIFDPVSTREDVKAFAAVATNLDLFYPEAVRTKNLRNIALKGMSNTRPARPVDMKALEEKIVESGVIDIDLPDADGVQRKLTDQKGKVVLLNFCAYAQEGSAMSVLTLRELYNQYAEQGLEIFQVGLDENEHFWKMAVDNLPWICVRDTETNWYLTRTGLPVFESRYATLYGVRSLPTYFIVNRDNELTVRIDDERALADAVAEAMK